MLTDEDDVSFERRLLDAGRLEREPVEKTSVALARFAASAAGFQCIAATLPNTGAAPVVDAWRGLWSAAKWLTVGVVAGGALAFAWIEPVPSASDDRSWPSPAASSLALPSAAKASPSARLSSSALEPAASRPISSAARLTRMRQPSVSTSGADLSAEVAAIDAMRTALAIGAWRDLDDQRRRYRLQFVRGALRNEAEALFIEGLVRQGRQQEAARAAQRFIASHPRDPQTDRIRTLLK